MEITLISHAAVSFFFLTLFLPSSFHPLHAQQTYINNKQDNCTNNASETLGYVCNGPQASCNAYLIIRSTPLYDSAIAIAYRLGADSKMIAQFNNVNDVEKIPNNTQVIVPVSCSCSGGFYQHNASYTLKSEEGYYVVSYDSYQGLTTCQAMMNQNPQDSSSLEVGMNLSVPLRCACPTQTQINNGFKYLITYPIVSGDDVVKIARWFQIDQQSLLDANKKSVTDDTIYPFTPFLIPLKTEPPAATNATVTPPPPPAESPQVSLVPEPIPVPADERGSNRNKWVFIGVGIGAGFCLLVLAAVWVCLLLRPRHRQEEMNPIQEDNKLEESFVGFKDLSGTVFSQGIREAVESLTVYKFEELQRATDFFSNDRIIKGSVYRGVIQGAAGAIKAMNGDVTTELKILKQVRHSNLIRLSGFCLYQGNTYLVHEFAENGSLNDWLRGKGNQSSASTLSWKQRVQISHDIADGLNYLHNYSSPPYIHKDLKSSNILLDSNFRAKVANFGLARSAVNQEGGLPMTRHVVGTQGYMAPEYLEHGLITTKLDVFAFGVLLLELLSGREALVNTGNEETGGDMLLSASIKPILEAEDAKGKLKAFIDPCLQNEYPYDLAFTMSELAMNCVVHDLNSRPSMDEVVILLSKILSSSLHWDPASDGPN